MKKAVFSVIVLVSCCAVFCGCIKNTPNVTTINPFMTATIGTYNFTASTVVPSTLDTQTQKTSTHDTFDVLYITGNAENLLATHDKIVLSISRYRGLTGTYSIVKSEAGAAYYHGSVISPAVGGIVSVTRITSNSIIGYFSFSTSDGINVTNGSFNVGKP
jgi:hypothetical protein